MNPLKKMSLPDLNITMEWAKAKWDLTKINKYRDFMEAAKEEIRYRMDLIMTDWDFLR